MDGAITQQEFVAHCKENKKTDDKLEKLMPLADLIPALEEIVENQRAMTLVGRKALRIIGYIAAVVGMIIGILELYKRVK